MNINGRMKVKTLRAEFKDEFGLTLRVYDGRNFADDNSTLASIRKGNNKGDEFSPRKSTRVENLENKIMNIFGIKVQISGSDDSYLCKNELTLAKALDKDTEKLDKRIKKTEDSVDSNEGKDGDESNNTNYNAALIISKLNKFLNDLSEDEQYETLEGLLKSIKDDEIGGGMFFEAQAEIYEHYDDIFQYARKEYSLDAKGLLSTLIEMINWFEKKTREFDVTYGGDTVSETMEELMDEIEQHF